MGGMGSLTKLLTIKVNYALVERDHLNHVKRWVAMEFHCTVCKQYKYVDHWDWGPNLEKEDGRTHIYFKCRGCEVVTCFNKSWFRWHKNTQRMPYER